MNCNACGKIIEDGSLFCAFCGNRIDAVNVQSPTVNEKVCPRCQERYPEDELFCSKCGYTFGLSKKTTTSSSSAGRKPKGFANVCKFLSITTFGFNILILILTTVAAFITFRYGGYFIGMPAYISNLLPIIPMFVISVGLIIGKNNPVPGIGYLLYFLTCVVSLFINRNSAVAPAMLLCVAYVFLAVLFFVKTGVIKKLWFVPSILAFAATVIATISTVQELIAYAEQRIELLNGYYGVLDVWDVVGMYEIIVFFARVIIMYLLPLGTCFYSGFAASRLWVPEDNSADEAVQSYINSIY